LLDDDALTLMISAYPDLKPWQVKQYCTSSGSEESSLYYYKYMTLLLDPTDGMQKARQDKELVSVSVRSAKLVAGKDFYTIFTALTRYLPFS